MDSKKAKQAKKLIAEIRARMGFGGLPPSTGELDLIAEGFAGLEGELDAAEQLYADAREDYEKTEDRLDEAERRVSDLECELAETAESRGALDELPEGLVVALDMDDPLGARVSLGLLGRSFRATLVNGAPPRLVLRPVVRRHLTAEVTA